MRQIEISQIDTHFERFRIKDKNREKSLLTSILQQGIREPLRGVTKPEGQLILLDGFKRLRCCTKLGLHIVPVVSLGNDEAVAILQLIRLSNDKSLSIIEQAALVDELKGTYSMNVREIAHHLECSPAWVSVRLGIVDEMTKAVKEAVFSGRFPFRSYMYTLRQFTRVNNIKKKEVDTFVKLVSGKGLSTRDIETLAHGFFQGGQKLKEQIRQGDINWTLSQMRREAARTSKESLFCELEKRTITDLQLVQKYMERVMYEIGDFRLKTSSAFTTAHLLVEGILGKCDIFIKTLTSFYDQRKQKKSHSDPL